ncbi:hypothetical protein DER46DRAFT_506002, partial [Fusarium sp. MPI-SDFR-AT-0072]
ICICDVKDTDMVRQLECQQTFHSDRIAAWYLAEHDTCPVCIRNFVVNDYMPQRPQQAHV